MTKQYMTKDGEVTSSLATAKKIAKAESKELGYSHVENTATQKVVATYRWGKQS